jgi:hypothetical protein
MHYGIQRGKCGKVDNAAGVKALRIKMNQIL